MPIAERRESVAEFQTVARASEVPPGEMKLVEVDGEEVVIANVDGEYFAHQKSVHT